MARKIIPIGEAARFQPTTTGGPVSNRKRRTAAQEEALRLRTETAQREGLEFGVKTSPRLTDNDFDYMGIDEDAASGQPTLIDQVNTIGSSLTGMSIMEEIQMDRLNDKLRPFTEGEPIGACDNRPRAEAAPSLYSHNEIMDDRQKALLERQQQNDRTLARLKEAR